MTQGSSETPNKKSLPANESFAKQLVEEGAMAEDKEQSMSPKKLKVVNAADWLSTDPPVPNMLLNGLFDAGDKVVIVGGPKMRKTFFTIQFALCLASRGEFLKWTSEKLRSVLIVQSEVRDLHYHRRVRMVADALGIGPEDVGDRLRIMNMRGVEVDLLAIAQRAKELKSEVVIFDPLYKLIDGDENTAVDMKRTLVKFDCLAERTGAAVVYVHHDKKGNAADRSIRDRGAGSNTLIRDCDLLITLTAHQKEKDAAVVGVLNRNYPPQNDFSIRWSKGAFEVATDLAAVTARSGSEGNKNPTSDIPLEEFLPKLIETLDGQAMPKGMLIDQLRTAHQLTKVRAGNLISLALQKGEVIDWDGCFPRSLWIGTKEVIERKIREHEEEKQKQKSHDIEKKERGKPTKTPVKKVETLFDDNRQTAAKQVPR